jgi:SpoVK/Ycf46/Vps4 family AAA+-type ATPase
MAVLKTWAMWSWFLTVLFVGYSGSDLRALCEEAAMMPIRELGPQNILTIKANQVRVLNSLNIKFTRSEFFSLLKQKLKWTSSCSIFTDNIPYISGCFPAKLWNVSVRST